MRGSVFHRARGAPPRVIAHPPSASTPISPCTRLGHMRMTMPEGTHCRISSALDSFEMPFVSRNSRTTV